MENEKQPRFIREDKVKELAWYLWTNLQERPSKLLFENWWSQLMLDIPLEGNLPIIVTNISLVDYEQMIQLQKQKQNEKIISPVPETNQ